MTERIVCAVDNSEGARHALGHAVDLAEALGLGLAMVTVASDGPYPYGNRGALERTRRQAWLHAEDLFDELRTEHGLGSEVPGVVMHGPVAERLVEVSAEPDNVMLVVGTRGRGPLKSAMLGSVSSALATSAACPVMVVPPPAGRAAASHSGGVVVGLADARLESAEVTFAEYLAAGLGETLRVVQVDTTISLLPPARAIEQFARTEGARLIVVGSHGRGRFGTLLIGSLSAQLTASGGRPVVVVPPYGSPSDEGERVTASAAA